MYFSIDWLNERLAAIPGKKERQEQLMMFITSASDFLVDDCLRLAQGLAEEAKADNDPGLLAFARLYIAFCKRMKGQPGESRAAFQEAEQEVTRLEPSFATAIVNQMVAFEYWGAGLRDKAFELAYQGLKIGETTGSEGIGWAGFQLGVFHFDLKDYETAMRYFRKAETEAAANNLTYQLARTQSGIGGIFIARNELDEGIRCNTLALEGYRECGHQVAISRALNDLGVIRFRQGDLVSAETDLREALLIRERMRYMPGVITSQTELARVLLAQQKNAEAETLLRAALELATETRAKQKVVQCHLLLADVYKQKQEPWKALEHLEHSYAVKAEIAGEETSNRIKHLQQKHATEQSAHEAEIHRLKNVELRKAYDEIEEKNKNITDSINYAQRIQYALLAPGDFLKTNLPEHFILFQPKDIVSGDFYWAASVPSFEFEVSGSELAKTNSKLETRNAEHFFIAVCDSTGHGVPGAFMSLLNSSFLNEAINEKGIREPNLVLDYVRERLVHSIGEGEQKDGMDCTLIRFDAGSNTITYAAAHNSPVLVRNGKVTDLEADKMPVGQSEKSRPFSAFSVNVQPGDMLYLLTDGYSDQFGGPRGKKFKYKNLLSLLETISALPPAEQKETLEHRFHDWKGGLEQLDDILLVGIKM